MRFFCLIRSSERQPERKVFRARVRLHWVSHSEQCRNRAHLAITHLVRTACQNMYSRKQPHQFSKPLGSIARLLCPSKHALARALEQLESLSLGTRTKGRFQRVEQAEYTGADALLVSERYECCCPSSPEWSELTDTHMLRSCLLNEPAQCSMM